MNDVLMPVSEYEGKKVVFARDLKAFLDIAGDFSHWVKFKISKHGLVENRDYRILSYDEFGKLERFNNVCRLNLPKRKEYIFTVEAAKEIVKAARFSASTDSDLELALQQISACRWAPIPYPYLRYPSYVSEDGKVCIVFNGKVREEKRKDEKRVNNRVVLPTITNNKVLMVAKCVYLAFNVGKWIDDIDILHIDNDPNNCSLSNLKVREVETNVDFMSQLTDIYALNFDTFVERIYSRYSISYEDSRDVVQDSFIRMALKCNFDLVYSTFEAAWFSYCKFMAMKYYHRNVHLQAIPEKLGEYWFGYEIPFESRINDEKTKDIVQMLLYGYTHDEIGKKYNTYWRTLLPYIKDKLNIKIKKRGHYELQI